MTGRMISIDQVNLMRKMYDGCTRTVLATDNIDEIAELCGLIKVSFVIESINNNDDEKRTFYLTNLGINALNNIDNRKEYI